MGPGDDQPFDFKIFVKGEDVRSPKKAAIGLVICLIVLFGILLKRDSRPRLSQVQMRIHISGDGSGDLLKELADRKAASGILDSESTLLSSDVGYRVQNDGFIDVRFDCRGMSRVQTDERTNSITAELVRLADDRDAKATEVTRIEVDL